MLNLLLAAESLTKQRDSLTRAAEKLEAQDWLAQAIAQDYRAKALTCEAQRIALLTSLNESENN